MIDANSISKQYNGTAALKNISFQVEEGELFGFIGPDGAGKSSLFRILTSLLLPDSGQVKIFGFNVVDDYKHIRKITGYMPGRFSLYSDLSVEENLEFFATVFGTTIKENYHIIRNVYNQIEPFKKRRAGKLSGGMKQKLALSCALIHNPKLLVLDEPTTGVDAVSRKEFWELLKDLKKNGITIVISTPYMDEAQLCDRVALIQHGEILSVDKPGNIIRNYNRVVYSVKADNMYELLKDLRGFPETLHAYAFGDVIHYTCKNDSLDAENIVLYLENKQHSSIEVNIITPDIEDIFIDLMQSKNNQ